MPLSESAIQLFSQVKALVDPVFNGIGLRLDDFDARLKAIPAGAKGDQGIPGKDVDLVVVQQLVDKAVAGVERIAGVQGHQGPMGLTGAPGDPGIHGKDADPEVIRLEVARAVAEIPKPKDGAPGDSGRDADPALIKAEIDQQFAAMAAEFVEGLNDD